ncbi:hypothetical protein GCM10010243_47230 [Streptomyces matensis]|nr:hypothetical protein GCM10010243_47230 [Streptomyces matensis]
MHGVEDEPSAGTRGHEVSGKLGRGIDHHPLITDDVHAGPTGRVGGSLRGVHAVPESRALALLELPARVEPPQHPDGPAKIRCPHLSQRPRRVAVGVHQQSRLGSHASPHLSVLMADAP